MNPDGYFFSCDSCSHPGFFARLSDNPTCPKCGHDPARYRDSDTVYCFVHRVPMPSRYTTTSAFLLTEYVWRGHQHLFPNSKLYTVADSETGDIHDVQTFPFCTECEAALQDWLGSQQ